jgi:hypothetical protein
MLRCGLDQLAAVNRTERAEDRAGVGLGGPADLEP